MKKITSLLLSILMLFSITAGIDFSAFAATALFVPVQINSISTKNAFTAGIAGISERGTNMAPSKGKYIIDDYADQYTFFEQYCTINDLKDWESGKQAATVGNKIFDDFAQKIGVVDDNMKPVGTEYQRVARIYYYLDKTWEYAREGVGSTPYGMIFREGRCENYADAFCDLATRANIDCYIVRSSALNHAWNLVKIDGKYYDCDVTSSCFLEAGINAETDIINKENSNKKAGRSTDGAYVDLTGNLNNKDYSAATASVAFSQFKKDNTLSTTDCSVPTETIKNVKITTTVEATEAGTIVKWNPVSGADWYEVYYATFDGTTNYAACLGGLNGDIIYNDGQTYAYYKEDDYKRFYRVATVHRVDKNEKGKYQTFIDAATEDYWGNQIKDAGGVIACVVAHSVDGWSTAKTSFGGEMSIDNACTALGCSVKSANVLSKNGTLPTTGRITYYDIIPFSSNYTVVNKTYKANHTHSFTSKPVVVARKAIVGEQGAEVYECTKCLAREMRYTAALKAPAGHTHNYVYTVVTPATCYSDGKAVYKCSCSAEKSSQEIPRSHSWDKGTVTKKATCTANGTKKYTCSKCKTTKTETIKATGHSYDSGKVTKPATTTATGVKTYTCTVCKATKTETIPKLAVKLSAPTLKVTVNANGSFKMTWNKVSGAEKYELYYKAADGSYKVMKTTTDTSFTTGVADYGKQYSYKIKAVKGSTKSAFSNTVNVKNTKKLKTPTAKITVNSNGSFKLSWNKVVGATKYGIYYKQSNGSYKWVKTVTGTSWTTGTAQYGQQYSYKVIAVNNNKSANSAYSNVVSAKNTKKLQTPSLKVAKNKNGSFKLSWGKVTGATKYGIYVKQSNGTYKWVKTVTGTSWTTGVAKKGTTYTYKVVAVTSKNKNATSNYSNAVSVKR